MKDHHHSIVHKAKYEKYTATARAAVIADLNSKVHQLQRLLTRATTTQESSLKASYAVALELAKAKKPLSDCEEACRRNGQSFW